MQIKNKFQIAKALFNNTPSFGGNVLPTLLTPEKTVELFEFLLARKDIIIIDSEDVPKQAASPVGEVRSMSRSALRTPTKRAGNTIRPRRQGRTPHKAGPRCG